MSRNERTTSRCLRWIREITSGAMAALASLGQRVGTPTLLSVPVSAALLTRVVGVSPEQSLAEVAQLLVATRHDCLPVLDRGRPVAVITRGDLAAGLMQSGPRASVASAPSHHAIAVGATDSLTDVLEQLQASPEAVAVIVDHGAPVGMLTVEMLTAYLDESARRA